MTNQPIDLIGAALGWGARRHNTQGGPQALKDFQLLAALQQKVAAPVEWATIIKPDLYYSPGHALDYAARLQQVTVFNQRLADQVIACLQRKHFPIILGGDHSMAVGTWSGVVTVLRAPAKFGLIWVDAHMDAHTQETTPSQSIHGMPLAALLGHGEPCLTQMGIPQPKLDPQHVALIGVRSYEAAERALLEKLHVKIYYMAEVKARGVDAVFAEAVARVSQDTQGFGVSIDIDACDPTLAPGTGTPEPDGLQVADLCLALKRLRNHVTFTALEIAEFDPTRDSEHKTAKVVRDLLLSVLC